MLDVFEEEEEQCIAKPILESHNINEGLKREIKAALENTSSLKAPPIPQWVPYLTASTQRKLRQIQNFINQFEYNHTGQTFFHTKRIRGMNHLVCTAKVIMREALPIQCVEAVFLGVHLTNGMRRVR